MTIEPFAFNIQALRTKKHYLLLRTSIVLDKDLEGTLISVPVPAGVYGFASIEDRDKAVRRYNSAATPDEIAFAVQFLQVL